MLYFNLYCLSIQEIWLKSSRETEYIVCYGSGELRRAVLQYIIAFKKMKMELAETLPCACNRLLDRL